MTCRHCRARPPQPRKRGLCWRCHGSPAIRAAYSSLSKFGRRGVPDGYGSRPLPAPTTALPRTPEKVAVLELRAKLRQQLWHPDDARLF